MQLCFYNGTKSVEYKTAFNVLGYSADDLHIRFIIDKDGLAPYFVNWALAKINEDFPVDAFAADNVVYAIDYFSDEDTAESVKGKFTAYFTAEISDSSISEKAELVSKLFDIYKEWCLKLINYNVDGIEYTMQDVNIGFNDMEAIKYLMGHIAKLIARAEKEMNSNENR